MRHKIIAVLCLAALAGGGVVLTNDYRVDQAHKRAQSQAQARAAAAHEAAFIVQVRELQDQCAKDKAAYNLQPAALKLKTAAPTCNTDLVR